MTTYEIVQIPTTLNVVNTVTSDDLSTDDLDGVREWVYQNLDLSTRHIVKVDGKNIGEAIAIHMYRANGDNGSITTRKFSFVPRGTQWFINKQMAVADRAAHSAKAEARLDVIENLVDALRTQLDFAIDYVMEGDTHGIHEDYQYLSIDEGGYTFSRRID